MKELATRVLNSAYTYVLLGLVLVTIAVFLLSCKMIDVQWCLVMIGYAITLVWVAINMVLTDAYNKDYNTNRTCKSSMWFMVFMFLLSTVGLLIKVVEFTYAILHG